MLTKEFEDLAYMVSMLLVVLAVDQNVIDVNYNRGVEEGMEHILNQGLEGGRALVRPKGMTLYW